MKIQGRNKETAIDQRSEEVTDIIERMPVCWTRFVVAIIMLLVLVSVSLGYIIKFPDTVKGQISITGEISPVRLVASSSGRLHLLVENNSEVKEGTCIGYIETGTDYMDILKLDSICHSVIKHNTRLEIPDNLKLGALSIYYNEFVLAYNKYDQLRITKVYDNMKRVLLNQQSADRQISENLQKEIALNDKILASMHDQYVADSILYSVGALSHESLIQKYNNYLSYKQSNIELKSTELTKQSEIHSIDIQLAKIDVDVREELLSAFDTMITKYNILINQILQWKEDYLFIAPIDGTLQYLGFWKNNIHVNASTEIFSVSPTRNRMIGELLIPTLGAGKVEVGQDVNVKLYDYPYNEYGYIHGKIETTSSLTSHMRASEGEMQAYLVTVSFPEGMKTNFGKQLHLNFESTGTGEVITRNRRLIQRLFDNLKAKEIK